MNLKKKIERIFWLDWVTWIGHGLQGVAVMLFCDWMGWGIGPALFALAFHFVIREAGDYIYSDQSERKLIDGVMDLVSPFIGLAVYILVKQMVG